MATLHLLVCFSTFILIANALELTPQLLSAAVSSAGNDLKTKPTFPFPLDEEVEGIELPIEVPQTVDNEEVNEVPTIKAQPHHSMPPAWITFADEPAPPAPPPKQLRLTGKSAFIKLPPGMGHHKHSHGHGGSHSYGSCSIEITSKVPGICSPMRIGIGSQCISGEYMEFYTAPHCANF
ncbi:uncharacterized protein [Drosophila tropicalis]|uniref:uncharacterized protein n=1 Tax=Drosophila tropicalis TaxID=46794 RepID=UPI0035ABD690